jgi:hypothetical protein
LQSPWHLVVQAFHVGTAPPPAAAALDAQQSVLFLSESRVLLPGEGGTPQNSICGEARLLGAKK